MVTVLILGFQRNPTYDEVMMKTLVPFVRKTIRENFEDFMIMVSGWKGEAQGIKEFLVYTGIPSRCIWLETNACRTFENISFSFKALFGFEDCIKRVILIGEARSEEKALWLAPRIYKRIYRKAIIPDFEYVPLPLLDAVGKKQKQTFLLDKLAFYCPPLNAGLSMLRKLSII